MEVLESLKAVPRRIGTWQLGNIYIQSISGQKMRGYRGGGANEGEIAGQQCFHHLSFEPLNEVTKRHLKGQINLCDGEFGELRRI
jgi:hypothetical protein